MAEDKIILSSIIVSMTGTVAICSLLTGSVISRFYDPALASSVLGLNLTNTLSEEEKNISTDPSDPIEVELPNHVKFDIAASVCLLVGFAQVWMMNSTESFVCLTVWVFTDFNLFFVMSRWST